MMKQSFAYTIYIRATAAEVWSGLTEPEFTRKYWWHDNDSTWAVGSRWEHVRTDEERTVDIVGEVLEHDHPKRLVLTWVQPKHEGDSERVSRVEFEIEPQDWPGGPWVGLRVRHADLDAEMHESVSFGWPGVCSGLKTLLEAPHLFDHGDGDIIE